MNGEPVVDRQAGAGRDETTHDDVLLEAAQVIDLAQRLIEKRADAWSKEMAGQYQLNPAQLREYIGHI